MATATHRRLRRTGLVLLAVGMLTAVGAAVSPAPAEHDPQGNNGTVKVDDNQEWDKPTGANANDPKVDCQFEVVFSDYDQGDYTATVTFEFQPPTTRPGPDADQTILEDEVFIGEDPAGGGQDEDARSSYDLEPFLGGVEPQETQGYHVKLTIHADGSEGADTKHKVFWVDCGATEPTTTTTTGPTTTTTGPTTTTTGTTTVTTAESTTTTTTETTVAPTTTTTEAPTTTTTAAVAGIVEEQEPTSTPVQVEGEQEERATELPRTGPGSGGVAAGSVLMVLGLSFLALGRRR